MKKRVEEGRLINLIVSVKRRAKDHLGRPVLTERQLDRIIARQETSRQIRAAIARDCGMLTA